MSRAGLRRRLAIFGPGLLLAATGVGAGDLATGAFAGAHLGVSVLWAVWLGALLKFGLNEALARHQLGSGLSFLEAVARYLGRPVLLLLGAYFLLWTLFVGAALMSACGAVMHAILPWQSPGLDKQVYGVLHSLAGLLLVFLGGFALFEVVMRLCIGLMFAVVVSTAAQLLPPIGDLAAGLLWPRVPAVEAGGLAWTLALMGGVGGTVTVLCHGYWLREAGRRSLDDLRVTRIDLAGAYAMTALFGLSMVVIGAQLPADGRGATLIVALAEAMRSTLGEHWRAVFLAGAWGAMFSSLLGVWQAVPYLFADALRVWRGEPARSQPHRTREYRAALLLIATVPMLGLLFDFRRVQMVYAVAGALFMPALAAILLYLNNRHAAPGAANRRAGNALLLATLFAFAWIALSE